MRLSRQFLIALKLAPQPAYRIAQSAGVQPHVLSRLVTGYSPVRENDARVIAVGNVLGLNPQDCFEDQEEAQPTAVA